MSDSEKPASAPANALVGGCVIVVVLVVGIVASGAWLWSQWRATPAVNEVDGGSGTDGVDGVDGVDGEVREPSSDRRPRRSERRAREVEIERLGRELEFARGQARVAIDSATRASWQARVDELSEQLRVLRGD